MFEHRSGADSVAQPADISFYGNPFAAEMSKHLPGADTAARPVAPNGHDNSSTPDTTDYLAIAVAALRPSAPPVNRKDLSNTHFDKHKTNALAVHLSPPKSLDHNKNYSHIDFASQEEKEEALPAIAAVKPPAAPEVHRGPESILDLGEEYIFDPIKDHIINHPYDTAARVAAGVAITALALPLGESILLAAGASLAIGTVEWAIEDSSGTGKPTSSAPQK